MESSRRYFMIVDDKIKEAEYFLDKIKTSSVNDELSFLVSAFLSATRSIPDYLLEDYNIKFGLHIPLSDVLYVRTLEKEAKNQHKTVAVSFIDDYKKEFSKLESDPITSGMMKKRNIKVHRKKTDSLLHMELHSEEILQLAENSSAVLYDLNGRVIQRSDSETNQEHDDVRKLNGSKKATTAKWYFSEYPNEEAVVICEKFLDLMKSFKNSIVSMYP